ncbi:uncharacterized protein LOC143299684 isoform X1 [Babylonia areolata]|uniref:uncharacterized protein LOC143299684 isoform X1 n=1 Tax=Babylonia areolata TaxID=304850 RepID=UPI003FCFCE10
MDDDSSTKFMESLTKFLQSLCNGYVEFQRGVELVGHIYLNIDTGEKVDYILHEKVSKNDENSVTFVSNSFHALPKEKDKKPAASGSTPKAKVSSDDDDDDIFIVDQSDSVLGSTNSGTIPSRGVKRTAPTSSDQRRVGAPLHHSFSRGSNQQSSQWKSRQQPGSASSQSISQENLSIGEVKLEQISSDELLSLASQVSDGASSSQVQGRPVGRSDHGSYSPNDAPGQQAWIKQEPMDESQRGLDTGWSQSDSSNSGSNLYPVMMHQNSAAFTSSPIVPGFSTSGPSSSSRHGHSLPGTSGAANPYANPMPGTSQNTSGMDPSETDTDKDGDAALTSVTPTSSSISSENPPRSGLMAQQGSAAKPGSNNNNTAAFPKGPPLVRCHVCHVTWDLQKNACEHLSRSLHPFRCPACGQDFLTKYDLCRHGKHCQGLLSVRCRHCPMTFSQSSSLRDHVQAKHSGQEYCCLCGARFKWRPSFNRHRKSCKSWQEAS